MKFPVTYYNDMAIVIGAINNKYDKNPELIRSGKSVNEMEDEIFREMKNCAKIRWLNRMRVIGK